MGGSEPVRAGPAQNYVGQFSATRVEEFQVRSPSGRDFIALVYVAVDGDADADLIEAMGEGSLNRAECPETGEVVYCDVPVVVHLPALPSLVLVIPDSRRHEEIDCRIDFLRALGDEEIPPPRYAIDFHTAFMPFGPSKVSALRERVARNKDLEARLVDLERERKRLRTWADDLTIAEAQVGAVAALAGETNAAGEHPVSGAQASIGDNQAGALVTIAEAAEIDADLAEGEGEGEGVISATTPHRKDNVELEEGTRVFKRSDDDEKTRVFVRSPYADIGDVEFLSSAEIEIINEPGAGTADTAEADITGTDVTGTGIAELDVTRTDEVLAHPGLAEVEEPTPDTEETFVDAVAVAEAARDEHRGLLDVLHEELDIDLGRSDSDTVPEGLPAVGAEEAHVRLSDAARPDRTLPGHPASLLEASDTLQGPPQAPGDTLQGRPVAIPGMSEEEQWDLPKPTPRALEPSASRALPLHELTVDNPIVAFRNQRVGAHFMVAEPYLQAFLQRRPDTFFQLHRVPQYPIITVLLAARDESNRLVKELIAPFDVADPEHQSILAHLCDSFELEVHIYDPSRRRVRYLQYRKPLEENVSYILERAERWLADISQPDFDSAVKLVSSDGFERIGAMKHNFHRKSFAAVETANSARLAVSIVGYWSEAQNFAYLVENRSFPFSLFLEIQRRAVRAAMRFGIYLPRELRQRAVEDGRVRSGGTLVELLIERFADLISESDEGGLDSMAQSENWDQLLTSCVDLGVAVDVRVKEMADLSRRRARRGDTSPKARRNALMKTREYKRVNSLEKASNEDLRELLKRGGVTLAASRELVGRGGETNILYVIESARVLHEDDIRATARFLAAGAEQFEPALLIGLGGSHPRAVHLCALSLALAKRTEALPTLVELLHDRKRSREIPIRDIVSEYGPDSLPELLRAVDERGPTPELVEVLALISLDHATEIIEALRMKPTPSRLEAAQQMSQVRRRLGGTKLKSISVLRSGDAPDESDSESNES